jgi:hypothetical protein
MTDATSATPLTAGSVCAVAKPAALATIEALARILENAARSHASGFDPDMAILLALGRHRPSLALECVARAAWALVMRADDKSTTAPGVSGKYGGGGRGGS